MNKVLVPSILAATVMVAGMFAFMPVEQASTVHIGSQLYAIEVLTITDTDVTEGTDVYTLTCNGDAMAVHTTIFHDLQGTNTDGTVTVASTAFGDFATAFEIDGAFPISFNEFVVNNGEDITFTLGGTPDTDDGDLELKVVVQKAATVACSLTETT